MKAPNTNYLIRAIKEEYKKVLSEFDLAPGMEKPGLSGIAMAPPMSMPKPKLAPPKPTDEPAPEDKEEPAEEESVDVSPEEYLAYYVAKKLDFDFDHPSEAAGRTIMLKMNKIAALIRGSKEGSERRDSYITYIRKWFGEPMFRTYTKEFAASFLATVKGEREKMPEGIDLSDLRFAYLNLRNKLGSQEKITSLLLSMYEGTILYITDLSKEEGNLPADHADITKEKIKRENSEWMKTDFKIFLAGNYKRGESPSNL